MSLRDAGRVAAWLAVVVTAGAAATAADVQPPRGLFVCRGPNATPEREVDYPFVDGWLVRPGWDRVEPRPGEFEWAFIDQELALARRLGKRVTLCVLGGPQTPDWVYQAGAASFDFTLRLPQREPRAVRLPLLWDPVYQRRWSELVAALGRRYGRAAELALVHITGATANGLEMQLPFSPAETAQWQAAGYTPEKCAAAWQQIVGTFGQAFDERPLDLDIHPVLGSDQVAQTVVAAARGSLGRRFGVFGGWLSGRPAAQDPHHAGMLALAAEAGPQSFAAFQMIGNQTRQPERFAAGGLSAAVDQAWSWRARYFEVWEVDVVNPALADLLTRLHQRLHDAS